MHIWVNFSRQYSHNRVRLHVQEYARAWLQKGSVNFRSAADNVARAARRLDNDLLIVDFLENIADWVTNALEILYIILGPFHSFLGLVPFGLLAQQGFLLSS